MGQLHCSWKHGKTSRHDAAASACAAAATAASTQPRCPHMLVYPAMSAGSETLSWLGAVSDRLSLTCAQVCECTGTVWGRIAAPTWCMIHQACLTVHRGILVRVSTSFGACCSAMTGQYLNRLCVLLAASTRRQRRSTAQAAHHAEVSRPIAKAPHPRHTTSASGLSSCRPAILNFTLRTSYACIPQPRSLTIDRIEWRPICPWRTRHFARPAHLHARSASARY